MSQFQVLKGLCREERESEIWKVRKLCPKGEKLHGFLEQKAELAVQGGCAAQKRLSQPGAEMDTRNWEQRNDDIALCETNWELESQRLELYQANQWADQAQREKMNLCEELEMRNRLFQECRARNCQEVKDLTKYLCNRGDSETASSSGASHGPSQPLNILSPREMLSRDSGLPLDTRNFFWVLQETFLKAYLLEKDHPELSSRIQRIWHHFLATGNFMEHGRGVRRDPQSSSIPTPRFNQGIETLNPLCHTGGTYSQDGVMDYPKYPISELHLGKFPDPFELQSWKVNFKTEVCANSVFPSNHCAPDQRSRDSKTNRRSCDIALDYTADRFLRLRDAWCEDCVCIEKDHHECAHPKESNCRRATCSEIRLILMRKADCLHDLRIPSSHQSSWSCTRSVRSIQYTLTKWWRSRFRREMGPSSISSKWKYLQKWSWKVCASQNYRVLSSFRLCWPCMTKRMFEITSHLSTPDWRQ